MIRCPLFLSLSLMLVALTGASMEVTPRLLNGPPELVQKATIHLSTLFDSDAETEMLEESIQFFVQNSMLVSANRAFFERAAELAAASKDSRAAGILGLLAHSRLRGAGGSSCGIPL